MASVRAILLTMTTGAEWLTPRRQTTLSAGANTVPPRFLKLWRMMIPPQFPARATESGSLLSRLSLAS